MKTSIVQQNIFWSEKTLKNLSELVSLWEEENIEKSLGNEKSKHLKNVEKNIKQKLSEFDKYYQKIRQNISF